MSRVGKQPIKVPGAVKPRIEGGQVFIEGPKGKLSFTPGSGVKVSLADGQIVVSQEAANDRQAHCNYGTTRAVINNMVKGVTEGWRRSLELSGVGFVAKIDKQKLTLSVGYSHDVVLDVPPAVAAKVNKTTIELESADKELLGTVAAKIRKVCPPEPYLGKGIKFSEETVRRKAGKTGKK